ncbi:hypothetical protein EJB05_34850, partial [Eragrostis curvula]
MSSIPQAQSSVARAEPQRLYIASSSTMLRPFPPILYLSPSSPPQPRPLSTGIESSWPRFLRGVQGVRPLAPKRTFAEARCPNASAAASMMAPSRREKVTRRRRRGAHPATPQSTPPFPCSSMAEVMEDGRSNAEQLESQAAAGRTQEEEHAVALQGRDCGVER